MAFARAGKRNDIVLYLLLTGRVSSLTNVIVFADGLTITVKTKKELK